MLRGNGLEMDSERAVDISNNPKIRVHLSNVVQKGQENYELLQVRRSRIPEESFPLAFPFISMAGDKKKHYLPEVHSLKSAIYMWCTHLLILSEYTGISE